MLNVSRSRGLVGAALGWATLAVALVVVVGPVVVGPALAAVPQVEDRAGLFRAATIEEANRIVAQVYTSTRPPHKDVIVQTLERLPEGKDAKAVAEAEFAARKSNGLLILVVKSPGRLWVTVGEDTRRGLGQTDVDQLVNRVMLPKLKERQADQALLDGLRFVQTKLEVFRAPVATTAATPAPSFASKVEKVAGGIDWFWVILVALAAWAVIALLRAIFRPRVYPTAGGPGHGGGAPGYGGGAPGYGYGGGGGGGWGTAILGGMFGAMAGSWLYNNVFGGHSSASNWGSGTGVGTGVAEASSMAPSDEGVVGGGAGGDWGESEQSSFESSSDFGGGGADFGDSGGSDFGGGDFGSDS